MASMAVYLRSRPRSFLRASAPVYSTSSRSHFSSSSPDPRDENAQNTENNQSNSRSSLNDVRSHLQGSDWKPSQPPPRQEFSFSQGARPLRNKPHSNVDIMEIRKNLSEFSRRSGAPSRPSGVHDSQGQPPVSFQELYKKMSENAAQSGGSADKATSPRFALDSIRQRLQSNSPVTDNSKRQRQSSLSLSKLKETLNLKPTEGSNAAGSRVIGGMGEGLPHTVFGKELREKKVEDDNELVKDYSKNDLGEKLRQLRPDGVKQGKDWFSLSELNERLIKLRELDQQEKLTSPAALNFDALRKTLKQMQTSENENNRKTNNLRVGLVGQLGGTPTYMLAPPKENLVEKYFHPDNMSSAEKLKLELKAVRNEFKMSETDCGSTRVQIAQLTTEISHLSKVLHKKDKHSKKGLLAKVQLRKKLLKYLRRTDWDSYCFILSKLGLRDNPGYKH